jgi:hypothetical protein
MGVRTELGIRGRDRYQRLLRRRYPDEFGGGDQC